MTLQPNTSLRRRDPRRAFTLIELLVVISVISILMGLLLVGIAGVRAHSRVVMAKTEAQQLAASWKQYYAEYNRWPDFGPLATPYRIAPESGVPNGDPLMVMRGDLCANNPRRMPFARFNRVSDDGTPLSPWADPSLTKAQTPAESYYYVMFDADYDNRFKNTVPKASRTWSSPLHTEVTESVIVWTVNQDAGPSDDAYIIGSWME